MLDSITTALKKRAQLHTQHKADKSDCYRVFHGATEGVPGLSIDRYGSVLLFQTWRDIGDAQLFTSIGEVLCRHFDLSFAMVWNNRKQRGQVEHHILSELPPQLWGRELGIEYDVRPVHDGIDPLLFLDFRVARRWMLENSKDKEILNLFAYTCGIGLAALKGGADRVYNIDFAQRSLNLGLKNAERNAFDLKRFLCIRDDVFPVIRQFSGLGLRGRARRRGFIKRSAKQFDIVVLDPPRMSKSPFGKVDVVHDYPALFKPALLCLKPKGIMLATNNVASVSEEAWHDQLRRCARKIGMVNLEIEVLRPERDFPSPDQNWPLKIALCRLT